MNKAHCLLAITISTLFSAESFAQNEDCKRFYRLGQSEFSSAAAFTRATEAAKQRMLKAGREQNQTEFCAAAELAAEKSFKALSAFFDAREAFGSASMYCEPPNNDKATAAQKQAMETIDQLMAFEKELDRSTGPICDADYDKKRHVLDDRD